MYEEEAQGDEGWEAPLGINFQGPQFCTVGPPRITPPGPGKGPFKGSGKGSKASPKGEPKKSKGDKQGKPQAKAQGPASPSELTSSLAWTEKTEALERRVGLAGIISSEVQEIGISSSPGQKGKSKGKKPLRINKLSDLPDKVWEFSPHDGSGVQFHSRFKLGMAKVNMMLDTGSGVNSTTEEEVIQLINMHA